MFEMFEKITIITLLYLAPGNEIKQERFEIFESCEAWFTRNVRVIKPTKPLFSHRVYHKFKGKKVIGYMCSDNPPT
tara:strand:+ start:651 stop:878 length:228 start_codon:yes stop_codon:yes gene_type:complete